MEIKGNVKRIIETPGYHITPKYDLEYLRRHRQSGEGKTFDVTLPLTSMIDMFSMLVVFLIMNFSSTGEAFFVSKNIQLPKAAYAKPLDSLPLVSISRDTVSLDSNIVGSNPTRVTMKDGEMPAFRAALQRLRALQGNLAAAGLKTKPQVNIQADQSTPILYVKRVMNVLISEGFSGINFAVRELNEQ